MLNTIRHKDTGSTVKTAQYLLGIAARQKADGIFSAEMVAKVCAWQSAHKLTADGIIGANTWTALARAAPTCSTAKNRKSAATCAIQTLLGTVDADGIFGAKTKAAVAAYQAANSLTVDGIVGQKTWNALICGRAVSSDTADRQINECVHYLQWDSRWKNRKYSTHTNSQTIGNSSCGPTAMAQILATWVNPSITPVETCALAVANGFRTYSSGTSRSFMKFCFEHYDGFSKFVRTSSVATLTAAIQDGALAVCSMNNGDGCFWTKNGHFITAVGFDGTYVYANDPNKSSAPRKQLLSKFKSCMNEAMIFWKEDVPAAKDAVSSVETDSEKAIIDISKWQGDIDFDRLKEQVSFVIVRAACGSDSDSRFDEYAAAMVERGIPFAVYGYSYAATQAKAVDEAQRIFQYAGKYKPLFYVLDAEEACITGESIRAYADELRRLGVDRIGCYVAHHRYVQYGYADLAALFDFTWIPRYGKNDGTVEGSVKPSYACDLWQYTSSGRIDGISGKVDMNAVTNTGKSLKWFLRME